MTYLVSYSSNHQERCLHVSQVQKVYTAICRKVLLPGTVSDLTSDAKFGGAIHIEALPHQDAVSIDSCCSCKSGQACSAMRDACTPLALQLGCTQVPLAASTSVTLEVTESSSAALEDRRSTYSLQVLSAQQMANKHYPAAWLQVSFGKRRTTANCSLHPTCLLSPFAGQHSLPGQTLHCIMCAAAVQAFT